MSGLAGLVFGPEYLKIGVLTGLAYGVLGAGLILVYRATRVINFAHGQIGGFCATVFAKLVLDEGWSYFLAAPAMLALGGVVGAVVELTVIRRLFTAPRLVLLVATIGVAQLLLLLQLVVAHIDRYDEGFPVGLDRTLRIGGFLVRGEDIMIAAIIPVLVAGLWSLLTQTRYGLDIRACAENPDAARLEGVRIRRVSTLVWALAGVLAAATAILTSPYTVVINVPQQALDPTLLLKALAAAMVGRLVSLPLTLAGGIGVGMGEALIRANVSNPDVVDIALFVAVVSLVVLRARRISETAGSYQLAPQVRMLPSRLATVSWVRRLPLAAGLAALLVAMLLPVLFPSPSKIFLFSEVLIYALVALSLTVLTGWAGQLSLGQFGFAGVGAAAAAGLTLRGVPFLAALALATLLGVLAAVVVGLPALRVRGLFLSITTLAFGTAVIGLCALLLGNHVLSDSALMSLTRPVVAGIDFSDQRNYYLLCLAVLALAVPAVSRLRRSGIGRTLIAVRDNEANAAAFTVSPTIAKLSAFAVAGGLAALAGALLGGLVVNFDANLFSMDESLRVVAIAVVGGLGSVAGAVMGAVYVLGLPALFDNSPEAVLLTSSAGLLIMLMYLPGGLAGVAHFIRDQLLAAVVPTGGPDPVAGGDGPPEPSVTTGPTARPSNRPAPAATTTAAATAVPGDMAPRAPAGER
ncbi:MAG: ABC transporter permease, partial [Candidatus Dormibacteria bacterium]